jgi:FdhE protein
MSKAGPPRHDPVPIGEVAEPPFVRLPDPSRLFAERAERFAALASGHELAPYLLFLSALCEAQHKAQDGVPEPELPPADAIARAREFAMPPLDRNRFTASAEFDASFERLLGLAEAIDKPAAAAEALARVTGADVAMREEMIRNVLAGSIPVERLADHVYVAAAMQLHFARLAARLDDKRLVPVGDGACPACGAPPVSSMVVGWPRAHGTRFCACSLCGTLWHYVRVKCTICASTGGISYQEIDGGPGTVKAETCDSCRAYVKILHQHKDPALEPVADDVASLALDLLVRETGYRRGGVNPFLLGN